MAMTLRVATWGQAGSPQVDVACWWIEPPTVVKVPPCWCLLTLAAASLWR